MKPKVYIETSVISYLTARPSRDLIITAKQQLTQEWWESKKQEFTLNVSQIVIQEAERGDKQAAEERLEALDGIPSLELTEETRHLARRLIETQALPEKAAEDALHIAVATVNGINYLLTWNFKHIANATMKSKIEQVCREEGYEPPVICSPEELMET